MSASLSSTPIELRLGALTLALLLTCSATADARPFSSIAGNGSVIKSDARGYLAPESLPDSRRLVPPPPAEGSTALRNDESVAEHMLTLRGKPRWNLARSDAVLAFPEAAAHFSCALGVNINAKQTPRLMQLLERSMRDASSSTSAAKKLYHRPRPFMRNAQPSCTPEDEVSLRKNGSYPSGHTAVGWAWGLILSELAPERRDALLVRGRAFGDSRLVCNVHWQSDVLQGRIMGAATVASLHNSVDFQHDLAAARRELAQPHLHAADPQTCKAEADALSTALPDVM